MFKKIKILIKAIQTVYKYQEQLDSIENNNKSLMITQHEQGELIYKLFKQVENEQTITGHLSYCVNKDINDMKSDISYFSKNFEKGVKTQLSTDEEFTKLLLTNLLSDYNSVQTIVDTINKIQLKSNNKK